MKTVRRLILAFAIAGVLVAAAMMSAAWEHNPQGQIHDETGVNWGYWFFLGSAWFMAIGVIPSVVVALAFYLARLFRRT